MRRRLFRRLRCCRAAIIRERDTIDDAPSAALRLLFCRCRFADALPFTR